MVVALVHKIPNNVLANCTALNIIYLTELLSVLINVYKEHIIVNQTCPDILSCERHITSLLAAPSPMCI